jgi:hypothetical protein
MLEEIACTSAAGQQLHGVLHLDVRGEHQDGDVGKLLAYHPRGLHPVGCIGGWHPDVHDGEVRVLLADELDQLSAVSRLAHHLVSRTLEQAGEAEAWGDIMVAAPGTLMALMRRKYDERVDDPDSADATRR